MQTEFIKLILQWLVLLLERLYSNLSKYVETNNNEKISQIQNKALELSLFLSLPAAFALIVASEEITSLFGYGSFGKESVKIQLLHYFISHLVFQLFH